MNKRNYSLELEKILANEQNKGKTLFLHSCCAPCSSYVLEYLRTFFKITVFYYNPNITEDEEYHHRVIEQKRFISILNQKSENAFLIDIIEGDYDKMQFFDAVKGLENCKEGSERCFQCFELRLLETAKKAIEYGADYFTTTLTISPMKNATKINEIGEQIAQKMKINLLPSDFKKKNGYQRSIELSKEYDLYRQDYCGCIYSKLERERQKKEQENNH